MRKNSARQKEIVKGKENKREERMEGGTEFRRIVADKGEEKTERGQGAEAPLSD